MALPWVLVWESPRVGRRNKDQQCAINVRKLSAVILGACPAAWTCCEGCWAKLSCHVTFSNKCKLEYSEKLNMCCKSMCSSCHSEGGEELTEEASNYVSARHFGLNLSHTAVNPLKIHQERRFPSFLQLLGWFPWKVCCLFEGQEVTLTGGELPAPMSGTSYQVAPFALPAAFRSRGNILLLWCGFGRCCYHFHRLCVLSFISLLSGSSYHVIDFICWRRKRTLIA